MSTPTADPAWTTRGKTVAQLIRELQTFEDQEVEVRMSTDAGKTSVPISLVGRFDEAALLLNVEDTPTVRRHE